MKIDHTPIKQRQKGLAAVEMTLVLPLLLLLFITTAEIGRMLYQYNTLTKAQRNGIRLLATQLNTGQQATLSDCPTFGGSLPDDLITRARNLIVFGSEVGDAAENSILDGLKTEDIRFCTDPITDEIQVQVQYSFTPMLFDQLPTFGLGEPIPIDFPLTSSISMPVLGGGG
jgi:hypothetical protein